MRVAFVTTQSATGSTILGRVLPLGEELARLGHDIDILLLRGSKLPDSKVTFTLVGSEPFQRTARGKVRYRGWRLAAAMLMQSIRIWRGLWRSRPEVIVIVKPLPANSLGVYLFSLFHPRVPVVLDVDDFELTANVLTSFWQRAAVHWSARVATKLADHVVVATPFLADYFQHLALEQKAVALIATGHSLSPAPGPAPTESSILYLGSLSLSSGHTVDLLPQILEGISKVLPEVRLLIAGDGDDQQLLEQEFRQRGLQENVTWHGRFTMSDVPRLIASSRLLLDPVTASITERAKSSFRVMAALAYGKPVVTSDVGIRSLLIPPDLQQYFFASPGDASSYAEKVLACLQYPPGAAQQSQLRSVGQRYHWQTLAKDYEAILTSL